MKCEGSHGRSLSADHPIFYPGRLVPMGPRAVRDPGRSRRIRFQPASIIDCTTESLFAPQGALRRLHRDLPQKELNPLRFHTGLMAKSGASPAKVMRREKRNLTVLCFLFHDTPTGTQDTDCASLKERIRLFLIKCESKLWKMRHFK